MNIKLERFPLSFENSLKIVSGDYGFHIVDDYKTADLRIIIDPIEIKTLHPSRDIVILVEPEVVRPDLYKASFLTKFPHVIALGKYRAERLGLKYWINFPVEMPRYARRNHETNDRFAIVNENKFSSSPRSQYGLRRGIINYFEKNKPEELDVFGQEWNADKVIELRRRFYALRNHKDLKSIQLRETFGGLWQHYKTFQGPMESDCEQLQYYKASITIENDLDYISEKIWKSLYAGCPAIYVGPKLIHDTELEKCLSIAESSVESIVSKISGMDQKTLLGLKESGLDFIHSASFDKYSKATASKTFFSTITAKLLI